jgi:hypothetical protein
LNSPCQGLGSLGYALVGGEKGSFDAACVCRPARVRADAARRSWSGIGAGGPIPARGVLDWALAGHDRRAARKGTVVRDYSRALNSRFIRVRNQSTYPPQPSNPTGELHEDEGFISFDRARKKLILRQFHVEGFVNQYVEDEGSTPQRLVFISERIENIPTGFRARETYVVIGPDEFEEIFELAEPGKQFEVYSRARLRRTR